MRKQTPFTLNNSYFKGNLDRNKTLKMFKLRRRSYVFQFYILKKDFNYFIKQR